MLARASPPCCMAMSRSCLLARYLLAYCMLSADPLTESLNWLDRGQPSSSTKPPSQKPRKSRLRHQAALLRRHQRGSPYREQLAGQYLSVMLMETAPEWSSRRLTAMGAADVPRLTIGTVQLIQLAAVVVTNVTVPPLLPRQRLDPLPADSQPRRMQREVRCLSMITRGGSLRKRNRKRFRDRVPKRNASCAAWQPVLLRAPSASGDNFTLRANTVHLSCQLCSWLRWLHLWLQLAASSRGLLQATITCALIVILMQSLSLLMPQPSPFDCY